MLLEEKEKCHDIGRMIAELCVYFTGDLWLYRTQYAAESRAINRMMGCSGSQSMLSSGRFIVTGILAMVTPDWSPLRTKMGPSMVRAALTVSRMDEQGTFCPVSSLWWHTSESGGGGLMDITQCLGGHWTIVTDMWSASISLMLSQSS